MLPIIMAINDNKVRNKVEELYHCYYSTMFYVAKGILHDEHLAEDAVSDAFVKIIDNVGKIDEVNCNKTRGYVVIIVRNISLNMIKLRHANVIVPLEEYLDYSNCPEPVLEKLTSTEACQVISDAILKLNKHYSDILLLKLVHECSNSEISKILGITDDIVRSRLSRARKALKQELRKAELI